MASTIRTWLDFAIQQMAAESYLDQFLSGERKNGVRLDLLQIS